MISLTHWLFKSELFNFLIFVNSQISACIPLLSENVLCMKSVLFNVLTSVLWASMWSVLETIFHVPQKECILWCFMECSIDILGLDGLYCCSSLSYPCCSSNCSIHY